MYLLVLQITSTKIGIKYLCYHILLTIAMFDTVDIINIVNILLGHELWLSGFFAQFH